MARPKKIVIDDMTDDQLRARVKANNIERARLADDTGQAKAILARRAERQAGLDNEMMIRAMKAIVDKPEATHEDRQRAASLIDIYQMMLPPLEWQTLSRPGSLLRKLAAVADPDNPNAPFDVAWFKDNDTVASEKSEAGLKRHDNYWYASNGAQIAWARKHMGPMEDHESVGLTPEMREARFMAEVEAETAERERLEREGAPPSVAVVDVGSSPAKAAGNGKRP